MTRIASTLRALLLAGGLVVASPLCHAIPNVWINEIHYDNAGGDSGEFVEIAGDSGIDLASFVLSFYNGYNGAVYKSVSLAGVLGNQANGFGFHAEFVSGIQNGSPDGVALSYAGGLVQFLSYEGSFSGSGGPASGILSSEISASEEPAPDSGSLQLVGSGNKYSDFVWTLLDTPTADAANEGQSFPSIAASSARGSSVPDRGSAAMLAFIGLFSLWVIGPRRSRRCV